MVLLMGALAFILALALGYGFGGVLARRKIVEYQKATEKKVEEARKEAENIIRKAELDAKELLYKLRVDFDKQTEEKRKQQEEIEKRLLQREENLERRLEFLHKKEQEIAHKGQELEGRLESVERKNQELNHVLAEEKSKLQKISSLSLQEARQLLLKRMEEEMVKEKAERLRQLEEEIKQEADRKAREIVTLAIQRCAVDHTQETTVSVVNIPDENMKGRIIGREGRNIRTFEMLTGVDIIIDDTPDAVILSGFDPVRRAVAKQALEKLVADGRIHPARIEEVVEKVKKEFEEKIKEEGKSACFDLGIHNLHPELIRLLGRLRYRLSFGQNALQHSKEVAIIMGIIASELGLDSRLARRIGLLHDIGKSIDQTTEGTHALIGAELAKKYGEKEVVVNAIAAHHEEEEPTSLYAVLAAVSDAISAARPGARRETLENYIKRLKKLEELANGMEGVERSFAIQAGREIRVMVESAKVDDNRIALLAHELKKKIEEGMEYPGQIKITVIRETRAVEYAK